MIQIKCTIDETMVEMLEEHFCEYVGCSPWCIFRKDKNNPYELFGYFLEEEECLKAWAELQTAFPELPTEITPEELDDLNWKEEYKKFLKPWSSRGLHWVPLWMKHQYTVPPWGRAVYFDAGMAFGTGNHETTQLCAMRLLDFKEQRKDDFADSTIIDAGCGSGILSISAALLGCKNISGFDRDPEAVRVSRENIIINNLPKESIAYKEASLDTAFGDNKADLILANIQADVICIHAETLLNSVALKGTLVLSGILAEELGDVKTQYDKLAKQILRNGFKVNTRIKGDWSDLVYELT